MPRTSPQRLHRHGWSRALPSPPQEGRPADDSQLDPKTQAPFLGVLIEETGEQPSTEQILILAGFTVEMVEHIRQEVRLVDFWRNTHAQNVLRGWIVRFLDDHDVVPFNPVGALTSGAAGEEGRIFRC